MLFITELIKGLLNFLIYAVLARVILSLVIQFMTQRGGSVHPVVMLLNSVVGQITDPILNPIRKILFSKAPLPLVRIISYMPTFFLYIYIWSGFSKLEYFKLLRKLKFSEIQQIVFDQMLPKTAKYYKKKEALTLLEHPELYDHKIEWVNECSWAVMATKKT